MDRIDAMHLFTRIVDLGSFTAGAEDVGIPRATATYTLQALESRLGVRLLNRTTRHVSPTQEGQAYYERCRRVLAEMEEAESFLGDAAAPKGKLRVDLQASLAREFLFPHLGAFAKRYPGIDLEIGTGDRLVDLVREGVDCVLRAGEPRDTGLVARRVALLPMITCASREYVAEHGRPRTLEQMKQHQAVNYLSTATGKHSPFEFQVEGKVQTMMLKGRVSVTTADAYNACCQQGLGFIQAPRYGIEKLLQSGKLVEVFPRTPPPPMPVSVMYPHHRQLSPRVRVFVDWVVERLATDLKGRA